MNESSMTMILGNNARFSISMERKLMYPGIRYFHLKKELPSGNIGDMVSLSDTDGSKQLSINGISMPLDFAKKYPDWFEPVTDEEHIEIIHNNLVKLIMKEFDVAEEKAVQMKAKMWDNKKD